MLVKKIGRLCAVLVLSGVSSISLSQTFTFTDALAFIDDEGVIVVPDTYTSIGYGAFQHTSVVDVTLPETINFMGEYAFADTPNLRKINIPSSLTYINMRAFENSGIEEIHIPDHISKIEDYAFQGSNLQSIELPPNISIDNYAFYSSALRHLKIGDNTSVGNSSFGELRNLLSLELGVNVGTASSAYHGMTNLQTLITSTNIGCHRCNYGIGFGNYSGNKLSTVILRNDVTLNAPFYYEYNTINVDIFVEADNTSNSDITSKISASSVTLISPYVTTHPIAEAPHGVCSLGDIDNDGYNDCYDQFPNDPDRWFDYESNDVPQSQSIDTDGDGILDIFDISPNDNYCYFDSSFGGDSLDTDQDGVGNESDCDDDNDGLLDIYETGFPFNYDISIDGLLSGLQLGTNPLNPDSDFDGTLDGLDAFPLDNTESLDADSDGIGNNADTDDDNDGHFDLLDAFPLDAAEWMDSDSDGIGNNADTDDDNDGVLDEEDAFPYTASESVDTDGDGVGDNSDAFPNDSSETLDTDLDGIGNNADGDDDNDGVADADDSDPLNDSIGALESQNLLVMGNPVAVNGYLTTISVGYDVSDANNQLNGIGFRVHYDSSIFTYSAVQNTLSQSVVVDGMGPYQDLEDFDNDSTTDSYILYGWAAVSGDWPNVELPAKLSDIEFFVNWADFDAASTTSNINFTVVDNNEGYDGDVTNYSMNVLPATWDFDGNGSGDALTDGLMLLRYTFGLTDLNMTTDAIAENATLSATQVVEGMARALQITDIDGNGSTDALTDGLMLMRYLFGLRGDALILDSVSSDATRTSAEAIEEYILLYMPNQSVSSSSEPSEVPIDSTGPVLTLSTPNPLIIGLNTNFVPPLPSYFDAFDDSTIGMINYDSAVDTGTAGTYEVTYSANDNAGNETILTLTVIVEPDYQDEIVLFSNGSLADGWHQNAYDKDLNWAACPENTCPNLAYGIENDPIKGRDVMYIEHGENNAVQAGFFMHTNDPIDLRGAEVNGILTFEVWSDSPYGVNLYVAVDCPTYPNTGDPVLLEGVGAQEWTEVSIPAASLFNQSCTLRSDEIGTIPMFLSGWMGPKIRIDNVIWKCETSCGGD